jgi:hypothetical protein
MMVLRGETGVFFNLPLCPTYTHFIPLYPPLQTISPIVMHMQWVH